MEVAAIVHAGVEVILSLAEQRGTVELALLAGIMSHGCIWSQQLLRLLCGFGSSLQSKQIRNFTITFYAKMQNFSLNITN